LTLIFFSFFAGWGEHHGKQGWFQAGEDMCGALKKSGAFRDLLRTISKRTIFAAMLYISSTAHKLWYLSESFLQRKEKIVLI
jgi:hypothetical protein